VMVKDEDEEASVVLHTSNAQRANEQRARDWGLPDDARASSRSWRSLDEEVRTASSSSFSLLTAEESQEQRVESGE
jgi:hypothetical protein